MRIDWIFLRWVFTVSIATGVLAACKQKPSAPPPQIPEVGIVAVQPQAVPVAIELPGRTSAYLVAEVRARVDGIVQSREFKEGSEVKAGQLLYKIDPAIYRAQLDSARAALTKAQASLIATTAQIGRYKQLIKAHAISQQDYDNTVATHAQAVAEVAASKAAVKSAQISLGFTNIVSPITGRIGKSFVTKGAYVQANQATLLATVQKIDPIYVDVAQASTDLLRVHRELAQSQSKTQTSAVKVSLVLEDGTSYSLPGKLQFSDITVDPSTGTIGLRALFPNPKQELLPGMFVRARVEKGISHALTVPQIGVTHDAKGQPTALIVDAENKVTPRTLVTLRTFEDKWVVSSGLQAGDKVIVQGLQKVKPGMTVNPTSVALEDKPAATVKKASMPVKASSAKA